MNKETINKIVELFDKGYCNECNELNCLGGEPSSRNVANAIKHLQQENQHLKETIEKAKEYLNTMVDSSIEYQSYDIWYSDKEYLLDILNGDDK